MDDVNKRAKDIVNKYRAMNGLSKMRRRTSSFDASYLSDTGTKSQSAVLSLGQGQKSEAKPIEITDKMEKIFILTLASFLKES